MPAARKPKAALVAPPLDQLPDMPTDNELMHRIVNAFVGGTGKKAIATKFGLDLAYVKGVIWFYLERYDDRA